MMIDINLDVRNGKYLSQNLFKMIKRFGKIIVQFKKNRVEIS